MALQSALLSVGYILAVSVGVSCANSFDTPQPIEGDNRSATIERDEVRVRTQSGGATLSSIHLTVVEGTVPEDMNLKL